MNTVERLDGRGAKGASALPGRRGLGLGQTAKGPRPERERLRFVARKRRPSHLRPGSSPRDGRRPPPRTCTFPATARGSNPFESTSPRRTLPVLLPPVRRAGGADARRSETPRPVPRIRWTARFLHLRRTSPPRPTPAGGCSG